MKKCEPCEFLGLENEAPFEGGWDFTPVCKYHTTHSWSSKPPADDAEEYLKRENAGQEAIRNSAKFLVLLEALYKNGDDESIRQIVKKTLNENGIET